MPRVDDVFGSNELLKATDLPHGRSIPVVIETAIVRDFDDGAKVELSFRGKHQVDCIRVDENPPVGTAAQLPPTPQEQRGMQDFERARQQESADREAFPNSGDDIPFQMLQTQPLSHPNPNRS
ncbi:hypothetical protein [Aeoliella sp.]|uniref:hypothetical protein n=1 Tax=Aeoliella sp. TaxID=2795800 RepID=UPI003CCB7734